MILALSIVTFLCLVIPVYVYAGYPVLLKVLNCFLPAKQISRKRITPAVSMLVSCYNEADVIEEKIKNCLELDYGPDKIEFIFVSDGSDDGTDEIIKRYFERGIKLIRQEGRLGKTAGLNLAVPEVTGSIIVFSDANAIYKPDAIEKLVRNFYDSNVGYVVGAALYTDFKQSSAAGNENAYWTYELKIKEMESNLHSVVGGDGAIYAIRKDLYETLNARDINDFVNPLQIIAKGYRGIFDAEACCYESSAGSYQKEGIRKERIVNRSIRGLMKNREVMNPFKVGFFSVQVISHKLLRWLVPYFLLVALFGTIFLSNLGVPIFQIILGGEIIFFTLALVGFLNSDVEKLPVAFSVPYYFIVVNLYSMKGVWNYLLGNTQVTWVSSRVQYDAQHQAGKSKIFIFSIVVIFFLSYRLYIDLAMKT